MKNIIKYVKFCLGTVLDFYPRKEFRLLESSLADSVEKTIVDANAKYLNKLQINNDNDLLKLIRIDPTIETILFYRIERSIFLEDPNSNWLPYLASCMHRRTNSEIYYSTEIGEGFNIQHGFGIVVGPRYKIGNNFTIHQNVTLGQKNLNSPNEKIIIGDNVTIFAGAIVLGNIFIGDNSKIAANSVVLSNVEPSSVYAGVPAKRIK